MTTLIKILNTLTLELQKFGLKKSIILHSQHFYNKFIINTIW